MAEPKTKWTKEILHNDIRYIDPLDCGSTVGYRIQLEGSDEKKVSAEVDIADCGRVINWSFYEDDLEKIDNAIEILTSFRNKLSRELAKKRTK